MNNSPVPELAEQPSAAALRNLLERAVKLQQAGDLDAAEELYLRVLESDEDHPAALHFLGMLAHQAGRHEHGLRLMRRSVLLDPDSPVFQSNLGSVLGQLGRHDEAIPHLRRAVRLRPSHADTHRNLAVALEATGHLAEAADSYEEATRLDPSNFPAHNDLGRVLRELGRLVDALRSHQAVLARAPDDVEAHRGAAAVCSDLGEVDRAIDHSRRVIALRPDSAADHSDLLFTLLHQEGIDARALFDEHVRWAHQYAAPGPNVPTHGNRPDPDRPLRIGYVSPDFRRHTIPRFIEPVLRCHDSGRFTVVCYSDAARPDHVTRRLRQHAAAWRDTAGLTDDQLAALITEDGIDLLVDLTGHMGGNRLTLFARKPAPVQVTYMGYAHSTGLSTIDYRITDALSDPPAADALHTETVWRLPGCAWCYEPPESCPDPDDPPAADAGYVTFGSFNRLTKLAPRVLRLWKRLLDRVPGSRLLVSAGYAASVPVVRDRLLGFGYDPSRVEVVPGTGPTDFFRLCQRADIALDPFPYNGMTTTCDLLWAGVPVITLAGETHRSRIGLTLLTAAGFQDLVARDEDAYVETAARLAADLPRVCRLRAGLRDTVSASPLCAHADLTGRLERAYREMWRSYCASGRH